MNGFSIYCVWGKIETFDNKCSGLQQGSEKGKNLTAIVALYECVRFEDDDGDVATTTSTATEVK